MESDFRNEFYRKYNSAFKIHISDFDENAINEMWKWFDHKYLPLINSYSKDSAILELGCGRGYLLEYLRRNGFDNLKGFDISAEQIEIAKGKGFDVEVADVLSFFENNKKKYEIIFALDFLEHFYKQELLSIVQSVFNTLDEDGIFISHTPNGQAIISPKMIYGDLTHLTILTPNSALQLLNACGFKEIKFLEAGPVIKNVQGLVRLAIWKLIKLFRNLERLADSGKAEKILTENFIIIGKK